MTAPVLFLERCMVVILAPVLLVQALWTVARTPRLPEPQGPRKGATGTGPLLRLLVIGDSSAAGVGVSRQDAALSGRLVARLAAEHRVEWQVIARSGATTAEARAMLAEAEVGPADVVVTALGVNDVKNGARLNAWREATLGLHDDIEARTGASRILVSGLPRIGAFPALPWPLGWVLQRRADRFEAALKAALAERPRSADHVAFDLDLGPEAMARDGFHPGPEVYDAWAAQLVDRLSEEAVTADVPEMAAPLP